MANETKPLAQSKLLGPAKDFSDFCEAEIERRRNSDEPFDEAFCREAMELVLRRLARQVEGEAA